MQSKARILIVTILLFMCIVVIGFGYQAINILQSKDRYVTVKGLDERTVKADLAVWKLDYIEIGDDITQLNNKLLQDQTLLINFLRQQGLNDSEIELKGNQLVDLQSHDKDAKHRYSIKGGVLIRSPRVDLVHKTCQLTGDLVRQGIVFENYGNEEPTYFYTQLNTIRPQMLANATHSARMVANQFARDSHSHLGSIRRANQGLFVISSRDSSNSSNDYEATAHEKQSIFKKVRLVVTVDYFIKDN